MRITIRPLEQHDLPEAERIFRLAFGTFHGLPDPMSFMGDADLVQTRWRANPHATLGAYADKELVGSNFAANWGSFGFFGPLTVRPDLWDRGIARQLLTATMRLFEQWGTRQAALFTFPHSPKHIGLYQSFGFWPQYLTPVMSKTLAPAIKTEGWSKYSQLPVELREACLADCAALTDTIYPGLDVRSEIQAVAAQNLGDTVLMHDHGRLVAFGVCHLGKGSEAGSDAGYIKFAAVRSDPNAVHSFHRLIAACEALTSASGITQLMAGVNVARHDAYRMMLERGFKTFRVGIAMQLGNEPGYNRPDCLVIDDWR
jgi:GNAT superfamily N-acetyltransferase